jgi:energy-coupling factor transporter ATP-binding protein EcfA2
MKIILIMGLPGAGKTTLANELATLIKSKRLNADEVRRAANDWNFSEEGRKRQSKRMSDAALKLKNEGNNVIADFICPTPEARKMSYEWDNKKPTAQMLGRWQPFHDGHYALFEETIKKTGQVCFLIRDVQGVDDNPFDFETVKKNIEERLNPKYEGRFKIMLVPNITNICYGRGVGYKIEEVELPEKIQKISATKIRAKMRDEGELK